MTWFFEIVFVFLFNQLRDWVQIQRQVDQLAYAPVQVPGTASLKYEEHVLRIVIEAEEETILVFSYSLLDRRLCAFILLTEIPLEATGMIAHYLSNQIQLGEKGRFIYVLSSSDQTAVYVELPLSLWIIRSPQAIVRLISSFRECFRAWDEQIISLLTMASSSRIRLEE